MRIDSTPMGMLAAGLIFAVTGLTTPNKQNTSPTPIEIKFDQDGNGKLSDAEFIAGQKLLAEQQRALIDFHNKSKESK